MVKKPGGHPRIELGGGESLKGFSEKGWEKYIGGNVKRHLGAKKPKGPKGIRGCPP